MRRTVLACVAAGLLLIGAPAAAASPVTIDFEAGATAGQAVTNQYGPPATPAGPTFEAGTSAGFTGLGCGPPTLDGTDVAFSGSRSIQLNGCAGGEFWPTATFFALGYSTDTVTFEVAVPGHTLAGQSVWTTAFAADRSIISQQETVLPPQASTTYKQVSLSSGSDNIAFVAIELGSRSTQSNSATGVTLTVGNTYLQVDNLTYDPPSSPPDSSFLLGANPTVEQISVGASAQVKIPITWTNNPNPAASPVAFELTAPSGVTGSFLPNPTTSGSSILTLSVDQSAATGQFTVTVDGYVDKGLPSQKHASIDIPLAVVPAFTINPLGTTVLSGCTPRNVTITIPADENLTSPLNVEVSLLSQSPATITAISPGQLIDSQDAEATVTQHGGFATLTLTLLLASGAPLSGPTHYLVTVSASGYPTAEASGEIDTAAGSVSAAQLAGTNVTAGTVITPELGLPGTDITLRGQGFCPGTRVGIGYYDSKSTDPDFTSAAESVASDGTSLTFRVPAGATTGPVRLYRTDGHNFAGPVLTVKSFRNTAGFNWFNADFDTYINAGEVDDLFGTNETNINFFGWLIRKPEAEFFEQVVNQHIRNGVCFGMVFSSYELSQFPGEVSEFPRTGGNDQWHLNGPSGPSPPLLRFVVERYGIQFTDQLIPVEVNQLLGKALGAHSATQNVDAINAELNAHRPVLVALVHWEGATLTAHSVLAYRTEPLPGGGTGVDVYNPNVPYQTAEETVSGRHADSQYTQSRIFIDANGHWTFPELQANDGTPWNGPDDNLIVFKQSDLPIINGHAPKLPNVATAAGLVVMGDAGDGATQVSDGSGRGLFTGGQLAPVTSWPRGVIPYPLLNDHPSGLQLLGIDPRRAGPLTLTIRRGARGGAMHFSLPGLQASLLAGVHSGQIDHVTVDPRTASFGYATNAAHPTLSGTLLSSPHPPPATGTAAAAATGELSDHVVQFRTTSGPGASDQFGFARGGTLVIRHAGPAERMSLKLSSFAADGHPQAVDLGAVQIPAGARLSVAPRNWRSLRAPVELRTTYAGHSSTRTLVGHLLGRRFATLRRVAMVALGHRRYRLAVALRLGHVPAGAWVSVGAVLMHGRRVVRQARPVQLSGRQLASGRAQLVLPGKLAAGSYTVVVRLLEATTSSALQASTVVSASRRVDVGKRRAAPRR